MKILVAIPHYGNRNIDYLKKLLHELKNLSFEKTIVVHSNIDKDLGKDVICVVKQPNEDPRSLVFAHRELFIANKDKYDLFLYTEDDILITNENINAYVEATSFLPVSQVAGFLRYEVNKKNEILLTDIHGCYRWISESIKKYSNIVYAKLSNLHSACYLLTKAQLSIAIDSGNYSKFPRITAGGVLEAGSSDLFIDCNLEKVINITNIDKFLVHHMPNNYTNKWGLKIQDFKKQKSSISAIANGYLDNTTLFNPHTKLKVRHLDKIYYNLPDEFILKKIGSSKQKILSIGCGFGNLEKILLSLGHELTAIPLDNIIASNLSNTQMEVLSPNLAASINKLSERKFDTIVFDEVLHYIEIPENYIKYFDPLLTNNGRIIAIFKNISSNKFIDRLMYETRNFINCTSFSIENKFSESGFNFINDSDVILNCFNKNKYKLSKIFYYPLSKRDKIISLFSNKPVLFSSLNCVIIAHKK